MLTLILLVVLIVLLYERGKARRTLVRMSERLDEALRANRIPSINFFKSERVQKRVGLVGFIGSVDNRLGLFLDALAEEPDDAEGSRAEAPGEGAPSLES